jgi:alanine racemase
MSGSAVAGAAVKADAYGLGAARASQVLWQAGCRDFFVAHWGEVADLLPHVPAERIAVLHGPRNLEEVAYARAVGVRPVLNSREQARRWLDSGGGPCHVMVDTGMNRLGLAMDEIGDEALSRLDIDICLSHLASADEDVSQNDAQRARFAIVRSMVAAQRYSLANSAGIALGSGYHADVTRPGIALYGGVPRAEFSGKILQVARPEAAVVQVRLLQPGDRVGYNALFTADRAMRVGILTLGYADGYLRCWTGKGKFHWKGTELRALGRISMDLTIVDISTVPDCAEGDWLTAEYDLPSAATSSGLSQYELLTGLGRRFSRQSEY